MSYRISVVLSALLVAAPAVRAGCSQFPLDSYSTWSPIIPLVSLERISLRRN